MAGDIKGITIEFRGDSTPLQKAIRTVGSELNKTQRELTQIDKALKFNPTNVELWRQKQEVLNQKIKTTEDYLSALKKEQARMDADGVDKSTEEYRKMQREIIETESKLKTFKGQLKEVGNINLRVASEQFKELGTNLTNAGQAMKGLSTAGAAVVGMLGAISYKAGAAADDLNTMSKVYGIGTGDLQKYAASAALVDVEVETIAGSHRKLTKAIDSATKGTGAQAEAFDKLNVSIYDNEGNLRDTDSVWQDVIVALGNMEEGAERDAQAMDLMGKSAADLNPLIADGGETYKQTAELFNKYGLDIIDQETLDKANAFNDSIDQIKALGIIAFQQVGSELAGYLAPALEKVVDLVGKVAGWIGNLDPKVLAIVGGIAGVVAIISPLLIGLGQMAFAISSITGLMATLNISFGAILTTIGPVILIIAALVAAGVALYKNWDVVKAKAIEIWNGIKETFTAVKDAIVNTVTNMKNAIVNTWNNIKTGISTRLTAIKTGVTTAWNNLKTNTSTAWNNMKSSMSNAFNTAKNAVLARAAEMRSGVAERFQKIKEAMSNPIEKAKELIQNAINKIKNIISGVKLQLPSIKLPHFKISGGSAPWGIGGKGSLPKFSVDWYARAMDDPYMFSSPTLFGAGEAGDEILYGRNSLMKDIANAVAKGGGGGDVITININAPEGMNVKQLADEVERRLIERQKRRRLAWQ